MHTTIPIALGIIKNKENMILFLLAIFVCHELSMYLVIKCGYCVVLILVIKVISEVVESCLELLESRLDSVGCYPFTFE